MMAGLVHGQAIRVYCGAVIVGGRHLVSAAHCVFGRSIGQMSILVGDFDYHTSADTPYAALHRAEHIFVHPAYDLGDNADIAVIRTWTQLSFNVAVGPVCLPFG